MAKPIYLVGGSKGGVGKSLVTIAMLDYLLQQEESICLVESDTSNPDVCKAYQDEVETELIDLDDVDGWIRLINFCESRPESIVVINTAARNNKGVSEYGATLNSTLGDLQRELITLWVINRQRDSVELLMDYMDAIPDSKVHVLRNLHFGEEHKFELFHGSKTRTRVEERGGLLLSFPDLADRVSDYLYSERLTIERASREMPLGNRAELSRWRKEVKRMFDEIDSE